MSFRIQRNIEDVLVCTDVAYTASRVGKTAAELKSGEVAVFSPGGVVVDATTVLNHATFRIGYKSSNGELIMSDVIDPTTVKNYKGKVSVAAAEQVDYVGYNGTSGAIQAINSNLYLLRLWFTGDTQKSFMEALLKYGVYESDATAIAYEVANGVSENLWYNVKNETEYRVLPEVVNSGTTTASSGGVWTLVNGSKTVTVVESAGAANDAGKYNGDAGTLVVGDFIRFGHATTKTYPVYRITAITGAGGAACSITLDREYVGASNASLAAASVGCMASATGLAGDFGIKITGVAKTWALGKFPYNKVMWKTSIVDFGTTTITESVAPSRGVGLYQQVAEAEWFAQGNEGGDAHYRSRAFAPAYTPRKDAEASDYYSILTFSHKHVMQSDLGGTNSSPKEVFIAMNSGATVATGVTATSFLGADNPLSGIVNVLDALFVAEGVGTAQLANV